MARLWCLQQGAHVSVGCGGAGAAASVRNASSSSRRGGGGAAGFAAFPIRRVHLFSGGQVFLRRKEVGGRRQRLLVLVASLRPSDVETGGDVQWPGSTEQQEDDNSYLSMWKRARARQEQERVREAREQNSSATFGRDVLDLPSQQETDQARREQQFAEILKVSSGIYSLQTFLTNCGLLGGWTNPSFLPQDYIAKQIQWFGRSPFFYC
jgi:hypothetical protein